MRLGILFYSTQVLVCTFPFQNQETRFNETIGKMNNKQQQEIQNIKRKILNHHVPCEKSKNTEQANDR